MRWWLLVQLLLTDWCDCYKWHKQREIFSLSMTDNVTIGTKSYDIKISTINTLFKLPLGIVYGRGYITAIANGTVSSSLPLLTSALLLLLAMWTKALIRRHLWTGNNLNLFLFAITFKPPCNAFTMKLKIYANNDDLFEYFGDSWGQNVVFAWSDSTPAGGGNPVKSPPTLLSSRRRNTSLFKTILQLPSVWRRVLMKMSQNTPDKDSQTSASKKNISLPVSRVRLIMKSSPDVSSINQDALFLTTKATVSYSFVLHHRFTEHC